LNIFLDGRSAQSIFAEQKSAPDRQVTVYIHRTDLIPSTEQFKRMNELNFQIKSVNWMGDKNVCRPIPIGIPPDSYSGELGKFILSNIIYRDEGVAKKLRFKFYVNFDLTTNIVFRKQALLLFHNRRDTFFPVRKLSIQEHLQAIRESQYVISPPGAGYDCYRTWESIYLGSTPVVLKKFWPFLDENLPVVATDNYEDFLNETANADLNFNENLNKSIVLDLANKFA
jgi:hypothetical protein